MFVMGSSCHPFKEKLINDIGMLQLNVSNVGELSWEWLCVNLTEHQEHVESL